jgi:tRNA U34 5-carboxymethylaminomethyl modifying enzyme MnmG/GidA
MIIAKDVVFEYQKYDEEGNVSETKRAVDGVELDVKKGDFVAILGHNGSGKSTLAKHINALKQLIDSIPNRREEIVEAAEIRIKYNGYIRREREVADKMLRLENIKIRGKFDYDGIKSLSTEARQKLIKIDPETLAQASRIPGVSPSDINVLLVLMGR